MEKKSKLGVAITALLVLIGILCLGVTLTSNNSSYSSIANIVVFVVIIGYTVSDFKIPHGNIFKYIMLIYGMTLVLSINSHIDYASKLGIMLLPIIMTLIGYMSGRLNKFSKNIFLMILILALFIVVAVYDFISLPSVAEIEETGDKYYAVVIRIFTNINVWLALCSAYITRFKDHKDAGASKKAD